MSIDHNGPDAAYPGPDEETFDTGQDSGLEQASSEPKQGTGERPEDWNPPPGNPGSDQDAQTGRDNGGAGGGEKEGVDDELGFDPDSPDLADPQIDPPHPARTSNDP